MSATSSPTERKRRYERFQTRLPVSYGKTSLNRTGYVDTISEGGLYIRTNEAFKVGTRLVLQIEFPGRSMSLRGEVAWAIHVPEHLSRTMMCGIGVSFTDPDSTWKDFFQEWSQSRSAVVR